MPLFSSANRVRLHHLSVLVCYTPPATHSMCEQTVGFTRCYLRAFFILLAMRCTCSPPASSVDNCVLSAACLRCHVPGGILYGCPIFSVENQQPSETIALWKTEFDSRIGHYEHMKNAQPEVSHSPSASKRSEGGFVMQLTRLPPPVVFDTL